MLFSVVFHLLGAVTAALAFPHTATHRTKSFSVRQVRNDKYSRNGPAEYIRAHRKWGASLPGPLNRLVTGAVPAWNQTNDREYLSPVMMGSPPQMTYIDIDTGSADLWVFTSNTIAGSSGAGGGRRIYHPEKSSTAGMVINGTWDIMYGDGSFATGNIYHDVVTLGDITVANATVQEALAVSASMMIDPAMSGIMGLSINHSSTCSPTQPTMLDHLAGGLLDQNVFAVDLRAGGPGEYHFGYVNASAHQGDISWRDLAPESSFWQFALDGVRVGGSNVRLRHGWRVVADTGTTLMLLPPDLVARYWAAVPGARLDPEWAGYLFPCNASAALPDLEFSFADGFVVAVPGRYLNFENVQADDCYGGLQNIFDGADFSILGDTWLKTMYVVFDVENRRLGLAKKKLLA